MSSLTLASTSEDAAAVEAVEAHHAHLAGELAGRVTLLVDAADHGASTAESMRAGLVTFCDREVLPHAGAEEAALYPAAHGTEQARLLVDGMLAEHRRLTELVAAVRDASSPVRAAAEARALQVLFEAHLEKENTLVLPLLAASADVSLSGLLAGMHEILGGHEHDHAAGDEAGEGGCGGGCACGGSDEAEIPVLDARQVPHAVRHATVIGALDSLGTGNSLIMVAPHDPLPLLAQIEGRNPGVFSVEYTERGPEAWRIKLTHR
jgi:uncharacterized protein (DUF2249 family)